MAYKRKKGQAIVKTRKTYPFKGIQYRSPLERNMAILLHAAGIKFEYESKVFELQEAFKFPFRSYERQGDGKGAFKDRGNNKIRNMSYTPDFIGDGFIIETKGYGNEKFSLYWKLFKKLLVDEGYDPTNLVIYKPQKISECEEVVRLIKEYQNDSNNKKASK